MPPRAAPAPALPTELPELCRQASTLLNKGQVLRTQAYTPATIAYTAWGSNNSRSWYFLLPSAHQVDKALKTLGLARQHLLAYLQAPREFALPADADAALVVPLLASGKAAEKRAAEAAPAVCELYHLVAQARAFKGADDLVQVRPARPVAGPTEPVMMLTCRVLVTRTLPHVSRRSASSATPRPACVPGSKSCDAQTRPPRKSARGSYCNR